MEPDLDVARIINVIRLAVLAHRGQVRKGSGLPHIVHPLRVGELVAYDTSDRTAITAAILHDVLEDTRLNYSDLVLHDDIPTSVADTVKALTWQPGERKIEAITRLSFDGVSDFAVLIKMADMVDNITDGAVWLGKDWVQGQLPRANRLLNIARDRGLRHTNLYLVLRIWVERQEAANGKIHSWG